MSMSARSSKLVLCSTCGADAHGPSLGHSDWCHHWSKIQALEREGEQVLEQLLVDNLAEWVRERGFVIALGRSLLQP